MRICILVIVLTFINTVPVDACGVRPHHLTPSADSDSIPDLTVETDEESTIIRASGKLKPGEELPPDIEITIDPDKEEYKAKKRRHQHPLLRRNAWSNYYWIDVYVIDFLSIAGIRRVDTAYTVTSLDWTTTVNWWWSVYFTWWQPGQYAAALTPEWKLTQVWDSGIWWLYFPSIICHDADATFLSKPIGLWPAFSPVTSYHWVRICGDSSGGRYYWTYVQRWGFWRWLIGTQIHVAP